MYALIIVAATVMLGTPIGQVVTSSVQTTPARDTAPAGRKGTAVLKGQVLSADTGRPVRRVQISASSPESGSRSVSTNSEGRYEFRELPAGRYTVTASRSGYLRLRYGQKRPGEAGRPIELHEGQTFEQVDFALPRMSVLAGRVTDEVGDPLANVSVFAMQKRYFRGQQRMVPSSPRAQTDDTGQYRLLGLEPGDYYVMGTTRETWTAEHDDKQRIGFGPTYYGGTANRGDAQRIKVGLGQEISAIDFAMVPGRVARISGIATTSSGMPLAGESIRMSQEFRGPGTMSSFGFPGGKVLADGTFSISNIAPGEYKLSLRVPADKDRRAEGLSTNVVVSGADIEGLMLVTSAGGSVSGKVVFEGGQPAAPGEKPEAETSSARMRVTLQSLDPDAWYERTGSDAGRVADDGTFELLEVSGAHRIMVGPLPTGWAVKSILHGGVDLTDVPLDVRGGQKMDGLTIVLSNRMPTLLGTLTDDRGQPAEGTVIAFPVDEAKWVESSRLVRTARPDQVGRFEFRLLPSGDYLVAAVDYVRDGDWNDPAYLAALQEKAEKVTVREGETPTVTLTLEK
jgi:hypothetical protein